MAQFDSGYTLLAIDADALMLAQRLMLYPWPGVTTIGDLIGLALRRLAETTED